MSVLSLEALENYWAAPEMAANIVVFFNIVGALFLGLLVGYERSYRGRAAGMRTYGLVCMASCALTVMTGYPELWYGGHGALAGTIVPTQVIQGITTGIGFLGAGVIMRDGMNISGLTTAASIWAVAAIGMLVGVGLYSAAIALALTTAVLMMWGNKIDAVLPSKHAVAVVIHFMKDFNPSEEAIQALAHEAGYTVAKGSFAVTKENGRFKMNFVVVSLGKRKGGTLSNLGRMLARDESIDTFHLTHARN